MADRLSPLDVSFLYLEDATTPMHVGSVAVFQPPDTDDERGFDYEALVRLTEQRIALVPRYRQVVKQVPGRLANPVWVDDVDFDVTYHVRRSALPRPGTMAQLRELASRVLSRRLDRSRPLWELYFVEGLDGGRRFAIITKTHHAVVDGVSAVDIGTVLLDASPVPRETSPDGWRPAREPGAVTLVAGAAKDLVTRPTAAADALRATVRDPSGVPGKAVGLARGLLSAATSAATSAARPAPSSPLNATVGEQRRYGTAATTLEDYRTVRKEHGGTVNDVILATVAGALRAWLLTRGEPVTGRTSVRAMVPVSVRGDGPMGGNAVSSYFVDLPVGEPNPVVRLHQVSYAMKAHEEGNQAVGAQALVRLSGFAPPTIHSLGARVSSSFSRRLFNLVVTNVPGPQQPLFAAGARMQAAYPVVPLGKGHAVTIGLNSYDGGVYYGLLADRDAMPDVDVLAECVEQALQELVDAS